MLGAVVVAEQGGCDGEFGGARGRDGPPAGGGRDRQWSPPGATGTVPGATMGPCVPTSDLAALLTGYLQECAEHGGTAPAGAGLDPFPPLDTPSRARRRPASDQRQGPGP